MKPISASRLRVLHDQDDDLDLVYEPLIPSEPAARERFVRETARHLNVLRPGLRITVGDWGRMLDAVLADIYTDPLTGRVVTTRDIR